MQILNTTTQQAKKVLDLKESKKKAAEQDQFVLDCLAKFPNGLTVDRMYYISFAKKTKKIKGFRKNQDVLTEMSQRFLRKNFEYSEFIQLIKLIGSPNGLRRSCDTLVKIGKISSDKTEKGIFGKNIKIYKIV